MKNLLIVFGFLFFLFPSVQGQDYLTVRDSTVLTNQDTNIVNLLTLSQGTKNLWAYSVTVRADSLTGANAGTVYLQFTNDGSYWTNHSSSITIDGPASSYDEYTWEGVLYARRMRVYAITPSGTRTVAVRTKAVLKKAVAP